MSSLIYRLGNDVGLCRWGFESGVHSKNILIRSTASQIDFLSQQCLAEWKRLPAACLVECFSRRRQLLRIKTNRLGFEDHRVATKCYSWRTYEHNWVKWPERESESKPLYNVETTSGTIIQSLCMSVGAFKFLGAFVRWRFKRTRCICRI